MPPLPVVQPQPPMQEKAPAVNNDVRQRSHSGSRKVDYPPMNRVPLPQPPPLPPGLSLMSGMPMPAMPIPAMPMQSTGRGSKSLMSLPLPQTTNDNDDLISYSPASPITPPPAKAAKKGIMDLPLPPGMCDVSFCFRCVETYLRVFFILNISSKRF